ncbi:vitamin K epoxide reductase family protein [Micromonospora sp. STR1_7]|uniref:Vitamin K epoxide reductase family protein n=1 Tax=Micromonospora parastrephiae TaxID=2806101 RepID=A0ABS1XNM8_9ACTN|nr:vitamin K epoxide reductase family protein [Micromonospora parastrephiae]MBM0230866.1 vitamin K epoxide reductase family protein [Micromonospora parastrephiae]
MSAATVEQHTERGLPEQGFLSRATAWICTVGGVVGMLAAVMLIVEKINLLANRGYVPSCSINPILSCGSVMSTPQAEAFGIPNPLIGIAGFAVVTMIGVVLLAGVRLPGWFWLGLQAGATFGVVFVHWLIYQSLYIIGALCPYCMLVWAVAIPIFLYVTLRTLRQHGGALPRSVRRAAAAAASYHSLVLTAWYVIISLAILNRFWDYWITLI